MFKATISLSVPVAKDPLSDFRKFLFVIWKHLNLPDPTPVQYDIAYNLQHGDKRMIIEAFRGVGMRNKLSETVKEFDAILKPEGRIIYLGTPQNQDSLYNKLPDRGYKVSIWPARYPNTDQTVGYGTELARLISNAMAVDDTIVGEPTDPARFSDFDLLEREASYGRSGFALQFMLDTRLFDAERYPLKVSDLIIMDIPTQEAPEKVSWSSDSQYIVEELPNVAFNGDHYHSRKDAEWLPIRPKMRWHRRWVFGGSAPETGGYR
jgi:hypothetical protein